MNCKKYIYSGHAIKQMFEREINIEDVQFVIESGEIIKNYPEDKPYPSILMLGFIKNIPLHMFMLMTKKLIVL